MFGTDGIIRFNLNKPDEITIARAAENKTDAIVETIAVPAEFKLGQEECFIKALCGDVREYFPTAEEGAKCQRIVDAILYSAENNCVVSLD